MHVCVFACACVRVAVRMCSYLVPFLLQWKVSKHELRHLSLHFGRCPSRLQLLGSRVPCVSPSATGPWSRLVRGVWVKFRTTRHRESVPSQSSELWHKQRRPRKSPWETCRRLFRSWTAATRAAFFGHRAPPRRAKFTLGAVFEIGERAESLVYR